MAPPIVDAQYRELLNPVKDPEKSFQINISQLLQNFLDELTRDGKTNFNSAALLIQGSASIYGKKVEYLHNLATQLYHNLIKQKKDDQHPQTKEKETKEKQKKEDKLNDPFQSTDIKPGKNLSCLKRKNVGKSTAKKPIKRTKNACIPVLLLCADNDDKGEVFNDTRGEAIGNIGDFALNLCRMTTSGWLLLPTINPKLVPALNTIPEYYDDFEFTDQFISSGVYETQRITDGIESLMKGTPISESPTGEIQATPDEGYGTYPESNTIPESTPGSEMNSQDNNTPSLGSTAPPSTDEGLGSTPADDAESFHSGEGIENVPTNDEDETTNDALQPVRHSVRQALKPCQLAIEEYPLCGPNVKKHMIMRRKIQKKNCICLPRRMKFPFACEEPISISEYCARTFFSMDDKTLKHSFLSFDCPGFDQNTKFVKRIKERIAALKSISRKNKRIIEPIEDEREIDVEEMENFNDADVDESLIIPFDDADVQIDNDPAIRRSIPPPPPDDAGPSADDGPVEFPSPDISRIAFEECEKYAKEVQLFIQNSDITERVHEWEKSVKPFLDEVDKRESFDIHLYGSRILNSFEDSNRKQSKTFKQICQNKQKWEIHRYFMALLPLANIGNVSIESERKEDGSDEIFVTLLSRKMHHKDLEEFGHNDGSHS